MSHLDLALEQIAFARKYTLRLLDQTDPVEWFRQPAEGVTHIAWQVGHLAVAEYWLSLMRVRGAQPNDEDLIPQDFLKRFGRETIPDPEPKNNPTPAEIRAVFDRVHQQVLHELRGPTDIDWDAPLAKPHPLFNTKIGGLFWCAQHELVHAGHIGLLRRLLGHKPLW